MLTTTRRTLSSSNLAQLSQQLDRINDELQWTVENELDRLREEERLLQSALKLKTRHELINSMEKELEMDAFIRDVTNNQTALMLTATSDLNETRSRNYVSSALAGYETLNRSIDLSDDSLKKSNQILDKLIQEYSNTLSETSRTATTNELLRSAAFGTDYKNQYALNQSELVRPNVVYASKIRPVSAKYKTYKIFSLPATQDLNQQQTLRPDTQFMTKSMQLRENLSTSTNLNRSLADMDASLARSTLNERELAKSIRDNFFYSTLDKKRPKTSASLNNLSNNSKYLTLPVSKTLVHAKPWVPGHVDNSIYYPYRSSKIRRETRKTIVH